MLKRLIVAMLLVGCADAEVAEQYENCASTCEDTEASCPTEFITKECTAYCVALSPAQLEQFFVCASCFSAVACDPYSYSYVCYPSCNDL